MDELGGGSGKDWGNMLVSPRISRPKNQEIRCPRAGEDGCPSSKVCPPLKGGDLFVLFGLLIDWMMPVWMIWMIPHIGEGKSLLSLLIQMLTCSGNTITDTCRKNVLSAF